LPTHPTDQPDDLLHQNCPRHFVSDLVGSRPRIASRRKICALSSDGKRLGRPPPDKGGAANRRLRPARIYSAKRVGRASKGGAIWGSDPVPPQIATDYGCPWLCSTKPGLSVSELNTPGLRDQSS